MAWDIALGLLLRDALHLGIGLGLIALMAAALLLILYIERKMR